MGIRNYSNGIWWYGLKPDLETTRVMPSGTRITQCENGVLITGKGYIRWVSNDFFSTEYFEEITEPEPNPEYDFNWALDPKNYREIITSDFSAYLT